ncbi:Prephenate dehydrogenase [Thermaerobacter marianensis DSM 12885]|uniref:Prephenate dehydrogenase n=1 Tax=Thermaerobacter marianensis (strain ATCC 700841 / DSM 12885 / JCM 10246 / 7p75a) TaxID=644966 RepID=E6SM16_THEM7|nr:prephenate dehydrogenase [Thermaerobacter marianensis]ADU50346.1 Prephenate dehydrogenase [Thermaerobacter marianensis DSM 12885]
MARRDAQDGEDGFGPAGLDGWRHRTLAVIGLGQIGGSLAAAARPLVARVIGIDRDPEAVEHALQAGRIDTGSADGFELLVEADAVAVAVPVGAIPDVLEAARPHLRPGVLVTDTGSVKEPVVDAARRLLPPGVAFAGGHPMAGTERWGPAAADPGLFRGRTWTLTPAPPWGEAAARPWIPLLEAVGARILVMDPEEHDRHVALTSHLPLLVAAALAGTARRGAAELPYLAQLVAGGFRDTTRVAGGHPALGRDMLRANWPRVAPWLDALREALDQLARAAARGDGEALYRYLDETRRFREAVLGAAGVTGAGGSTGGGANPVNDTSTAGHDIDGNGETHVRRHTHPHP